MILEAYPSRRALLWVVVAVHDDSIVCFVNEVSAAADIIQIGRVPLPLTHLPWVCHEPDVHVMMLRESLHVGQHLAHIFRFIHRARALVIQLIVGVNYEASNAESAHQNHISDPFAKGCQRPCTEVSKPSAFLLFIQDERLPFSRST